MANRRLHEGMERKRRKKKITEKFCSNGFCERREQNTIYKIMILFLFFFRFGQTGTEAPRRFRPSIGRHHRHSLRCIGWKKTELFCIYNSFAPILHRAHFMSCDARDRANDVVGHLLHRTIRTLIGLWPQSACVSVHEYNKAENQNVRRCGSNEI